MNGYEMLENLKNSIGKALVIKYRQGFDIKEEILLLKNIEKAPEDLEFDGIDKDMPILVVSRAVKPKKELSQEQILLRKVFADELRDFKIPLISMKLGIYTILDAETNELILQNEFAIEGIVFRASLREKTFNDFLETNINDNNVKNQGG